MKKFVVVLSIILSAAFFFQSCLDHDFDEPPIVVNSIPFDANSTVLAVKALHQTGKFIKIDQELNLHAVVIADDKSGNFYKTLVVQDATAGIEIKINKTGLYTNFPIGMKVGLKCKGLTISDYEGTIQLGLGTYLDGSNERLSGIEDALLSNYLFAGPTGQAITPIELSIGALSKPYLSTLIKINNIEFSRADVGKTYADIVGAKTWNLNLKDCGTQTLLLRTSNFASFGNVVVPSNNGSIVGVLSIFRTDLQLYIRDTSDVQFFNTPCGGGSGSGTLKSIQEIRALFTGAKTTIAEDYKIKAVVISDKDNKNINAQNMIVQDANAGIAVRFTAAHSYALGDEVEISLNGVELSEFNGLLQLNNVLASKVTKSASGKTVTAKSITLADLNANFEANESQLVKLTDVAISKSSGTTYSGTAKVTQGNESIDLFTSNSATFSGLNIPTNNANITAIVGQFTSKQLLLRGEYDVETSGGGGGGSNPVEAFEINFDGLANNATIALAGWTNQATVGTRVWLAKLFSGNVYAQATAFNDTAPEAEMWLISPKVNGATPKLFSFESAKAFWVHDGMKVMISTNFDGSNIKAATWQTLPCTIAKQSDADNTFVPSGSIDLSAFSGTYHLAFVYNGTSASNTSTYRVDNIVLKNK